MAAPKEPREIQLPESFRFIREEDANVLFRTDDRLGTLGEFVRLSREPGHFVVVKEVHGIVVGVVLGIVAGKTLVIERLARDLDHGYRGVGGELVLVVEKVIAPRYDVDEMKLEAINEALVTFYKERFGFARDGPRIRDERWGWLYPMKKKLS